MAMAQINIIVNGDFESGLSGWTATNPEINPESSYFVGGDPNNTVFEANKDTNGRTRLEQEVTFTGPIDTEINFDLALRNNPNTGGNSTAGVDGVRIRVFDDQGNVIASQSYYPNNLGVLEAATPLAVSIPAAGTYTIRIQELGDEADALGVVIDNVSMMVCFEASAMIKTDKGLVRADSIEEGDNVWTRDGGYQKVRWVNSSIVSKERQLDDEKLRPVVFKKDSVRKGLPTQDLKVSPNHRMLLEGWSLELATGHDHALAPAKHLVNGETVVVGEAEDIEYVHFIFDQHEIVEANGVLSESFYPGKMALNAVEKESKEELLKIFPELKNIEDGSSWDFAATVISSKEFAAIHKGCVLAANL